MERIIYITFILFLSKTSDAQSPQRTGRDYAVFFYVTDFSSGWASLPETRIEAETLKMELESNFGFICESVPNPSKKDIREKIRAYNSRLAPNDQALFYFSMHGQYSAVGDRGYLIGKDGLESDEYGDTWLSYDELRSDLGPCKAKHILLALDACHSGSFGTRDRGMPSAPAYAQESDCQTKIARTMQYTGRQYCSSGNKNARTPAKSLFAARFLEALRKGGDRGLVLFDDLIYFLGKIEVPRPESGYFGVHSPGGDFVFTRKRGCLGEPDRDGDQVPDADDQCPEQWGLPPTGCPQPMGVDSVSVDMNAWRNAKQLGTETALQQYLKEFPQGAFRAEANALLRKLVQSALEARDHAAWALAEEKRSPDAYKKYIAAWPSGLHVAEAKATISILEMPDDGMNKVTGGSFSMGCPFQTRDCDEDEQPVHTVKLSDYYIGTNEVTQGLWQRIMGSNPSFHKNCDSCPVENVSWDDIQEFLKRLNTTYPGKNYRLPTEAEWEYAARGAGKGAGEIQFAGGKTLDSYGWYSGNAMSSSHPVGTKLPNALGLYDMNGNVYEWCSDFYGRYGKASQVNPKGSGDNGGTRVCRGGSWGDGQKFCTVYNRGSNFQDTRNKYLGFRLARSKN